MTEKRAPKDPAAGPKSELEVALHHLQARQESGQAPSRHDARWLLLELGSAMIAAPDGVTQALLARARKVVQRLGDGWLRALHEELQLAVAEHVHAVDPRWMSHPRYDMAYTMAARERLEARMLAAQALGTPLEESLAQAVARSDRLLAEHRAKNA